MYWGACVLFYVQVNMDVFVYMYGSVHIVYVGTCIHVWGVAFPSTACRLVSFARDVVTSTSWTTEFYQWGWFCNIYSDPQCANGCYHKNTLDVLVYLTMGVTLWIVLAYFVHCYRWGQPWCCTLLLCLQLCNLKVLLFFVQFGLLNGIR